MEGLEMFRWLAKQVLSLLMNVLESVELATNLQRSEPAA
jgi:hypothetical protein